MKVIRQSVDSPSRPLSENTLKHNRNERGTKIPAAFADLAAHDGGCILVCATAGNDYRQGGIKIAEGSWKSMKHIYDSAGGEKNGYLYHIGIPDGTYFPDDYMTTPKQTFTEALLNGQAKITDIDSWVDNWHNDSGNSGQTLQDYLGLDQATYAAWLKNADALIGLEDRLRSEQNEISKQKQTQGGTHDPV